MAELTDLLCFGCGKVFKPGQKVIVYRKTCGVVGRDEEIIYDHDIYVMYYHQPKCIPYDFLESAG